MDCPQDVEFSQDRTLPLLLYEAIHSCLADMLICPNVTRVGRLVHNWHHIITCENCKRDYRPKPLMGKRKCDERRVCWDGEMLTPGLCELQKRWGWENHQRDLFYSTDAEVLGTDDRRHYGCQDGHLLSSYITLSLNQ